MPAAPRGLSRMWRPSPGSSPDEASTAAPVDSVASWADDTEDEEIKKEASPKSQEDRVEVQNPSELVGCGIKIDPLSLHPDVDLVHPPRDVEQLLASAWVLCDLLGLAPYSVQHSMVDLQALLGYELLEVSVKHPTMLTG